jgi:hypothetical protein
MGQKFTITESERNQIRGLYEQDNPAVAKAMKECEPEAKRKMAEFHAKISEVRGLIGFLQKNEIKPNYLRDMYNKVVKEYNVTYSLGKMAPYADTDKEAIELLNYNTKIQVEIIRLRTLAKCLYRKASEMDVEAGNIN